MKQRDLQPCELKVMNVVWKEHPIRASRIAAILMPEAGWPKNTVTRIVGKGLLRRADPGFVCEPTIAEVQRRENASFLEMLYDGSAKLLFARLPGDRMFTREGLAELRAMLDAAERSFAE